MTGITIEMLREPLLQLAEFIKVNLTPNLIKYFDLANIQGVKNIKAKQNHFRAWKQMIILSYQ